MTAIKNMSPFSPGKPVPVELFVGRQEQIRRIMDRGVGQVTGGKPMAMFIEGDYGIGKSSIAQFAAWLAGRDKKVFGIYAPLGGAQDLKDIAYIILQHTVRAGIFDQTKWEALKNYLARYINTAQASLFGFDLNINFDALKAAAPNLASPFGLLGFLGDVFGRIEPQGAKGIMLILDEINGVASNPEFARFLKSLWDSNAVATGATAKQLPLLLIMCGTKDRRIEMMRQHEPVERIFDLVQIESLSRNEMEDFFKRAFASAQMQIS